ncbi:MAG: DUF2461 domain-containing protein [Prevotella sp.]|jgi:uncharacterized protein (TIGR02453 family)|nr:DUF2461 domain-containing protein [Prevotella sp.]
MHILPIDHFLKSIAAHNERTWFAEHKDEFIVSRDNFAEGLDQAIAAISKFDPEIAHLTAKDCMYRFYRDTRFSPDKSPYKNHFGGFICAHGKKSLRCGYYIHIQPGYSFISQGCYWLPTNILTSVRNEIMGNIDTWRKAVENGKFVALFGYPNEGKIDENGLVITDKGFGFSHLKTAPKGFPKDYPFIQYLRMKDFATWIRVDDDFFEGDQWLDKIVEIFKVGKPMMDFLNEVIDDYE